MYLTGTQQGLQKALLEYNSYMMPEVVVNSSVGSGFLSLAQLSVMIYAAIALFLTCRIFLAVLRLVRLCLQNSAETSGPVSIIQTDEDDAPFSFFNWIFWNRKINPVASEGLKIMKHELYHAKQKHSFDIIFMELICAIAWLNPFFHLIKKEQKAIHEFLADSYAAGSDEKLEYAEILVLRAIDACSQTLVNPFFDNQLKRRINMLTSNKKSTFQYLRKILVLPVLALISGLFVISCKSNDEKTEYAVKDSVVTKAPLPAVDSGSAVNTRLAETTPESEPEVYAKVEKDAEFPGGPGKWRDFLVRNLRGEVPVDSGAGPGNYTAIIQFIVDLDGNVSDVKPLTKLGYGIEREAIRVIKRSGKWMPATIKGKPVKAYRKQPITFQIVEQ